ncbi:MAG: hypothetical protein WAO23_02065 [Dethiobacteria bacterium]
MHFRTDQNFFPLQPLAVMEQERRATLFFLQNKGELCYKNYHPSSGWSTSQKLSEEVNIYTAACGTDNILYLVEADRRGNLKLKKRTGSGWEENFFYREKKERQLGQMQLIGDYRGTMHLIYLLSSEKEEQWWLMHHCLHENRWREPKVIDFGGERNTNHGHAIVDKDNILHIIYSLKERRRIPLCHRTFTLAEDRWSKAVVLAGWQNNFLPFLGEDADANLHLTWCAGYRKGYIINYSRKIINGRGPARKWMPALEISPLVPEKTFPFLEFDKSVLKINWISQNTIRQRISYDRGTHWEKMPRALQNRKVRLFPVISRTDRSRLPRLQWAAFDPDLTVEHSVENRIRHYKNRIDPDKRPSGSLN